MDTEATSAIDDTDYLFFCALRQRSDEARARLTAAQQDMAILEYAYDAFFVEMREKYDLSPLDGIRDNGRIVRSAAL